MRLVVSAVALLAVLFLPSLAHADTFSFAINGGGDNYVFTIDPISNPATIDPFFGFNTFTTTVTDTLNNNTVVSNGVYFTSDYLTLGVGEIYFSIPAGVFDGTTFTPSGSTPYEADFYGYPQYPYTLTITDIGPSVAATPEPSSIALLGTGVLGVAGAMRRRFVRS